ncbi:MAG TPA: hypothetical protein VGM43_20440 [Bryobacteraceae bacterium]|jgi:hypothetical protein
MNHPNQQTEGLSEPEFAALIAIDWADRKHYWTMRAGGIISRGELENTPEAVEQWAAELHGKFGGRPLALAMEQRRGALAMCSIPECAWAKEVYTILKAGVRAITWQCGLWRLNGCAFCTGFRQALRYWN